MTPAPAGPFCIKYWNHENPFKFAELEIVFNLSGENISIPLKKGTMNILFCHSFPDEILVFVLLYVEGFKYSHLSKLGKNNG